MYSFGSSSLQKKRAYLKKKQRDEDQPLKVPNIYRTQKNIVQAKEFKKKVKLSKVQIESFLHKQTLNLPNVSYQLYSKLQNHHQRSLPNQQVPLPYSQKVDKFTIVNPPIFPKTYFWCSCGLSNKQPFCDNSHKGTAFRPIKFSVEEKVSQIHLCGCKYTTNAPYCDGITCHQLKERKQVKDGLETISERIEDETQFKEPISQLSRLRKEEGKDVRGEVVEEEREEEQIEIVVQETTQQLKDPKEQSKEKQQ